ncbi:MAG: hypothetical protein MH252_11125 [Thermosynechococcaceae cyanobacterium MS004]|nr:hypothetical protein [Thermosynechococcaceae cyanobacterium MS004]
MQYVSFADESYSRDSGFNSIAAFSLRSDNLPQINSNLNTLLEESNVGEFKWQKLKDAKYRFCAQKLIDAVWELIETDDARVDVVIWNINDSRHQIRNRDDIANYERMFYHLHSNALKRRPKSLIWKIYPDEGVGVNWEVVTQCIDARGQRRELFHLPLFGSFFSDPHYCIADCKEVQSHTEPCCQIADLFAGLSIFSRTHYDLYEKWCEFTNPSLPLFPGEQPQLSRAEEHRFPILQYFDHGCKSRKLGVSLKSNRYLQTPNPNNPINFWHYMPQHEMDTAPTKNEF